MKMKLVCCVLLCVATISAFSLQHTDHAHNKVTTKGQIQTSQNSLNAGQGHKFSLVDTLTKLMHTIQGKEGKASRTSSLPSPNPVGARAAAVSVPPPQHACLNMAASLLRSTNYVLHRKGFSTEAVDGIVVDILQNMAAKITPDPKPEDDPEDDVGNPVHANNKRGFSRRGAIQLRFAPRFGTKLVPTEKSGESGATLLRYGRSAGQVDE